MDQPLTPTRRDVLKLSTGAVGSLLFGSRMPDPITTGASAAPLPLGGSWEAHVHRASYIHERLGHFHHTKVFARQAPCTTEREALVFLGRFASSCDGLSWTKLPDGGSLINATALARESQETRKMIKGLSPEQRRRYWSDIEFWRDQGCYGTNASEDAFLTGASTHGWQQAVDEYFTKLDRDLNSYEKYVRHLTGEAGRSLKLLHDLDTPIAAMGREWLTLFAKGDVPALEDNRDFTALRVIARTVLSGPSTDRYNAASSRQLNESIEHLVSRGVPRVELELLGEPDARYDIYATFLRAAHEVDAALLCRNAPSAAPPALMKALASSYDEAIALAYPSGPTSPACTQTITNALTHAERLLLWGCDDGYGGIDTGLEPRIHRVRNGILLDISVSVGDGERSAVSISRDRYSGGRYYDQIEVAVHLSRSTSQDDRGAEVSRAIATRLGVQPSDIEFIPSERHTDYYNGKILISGFTARELAERLR